MTCTPAFAAGHYVADFTETRTLAGMSEPLVLYGHLDFSPGKQLLWEINRPYHYSFEIRDQRIEETLPDGSRNTSPLDKTPWAEALFSLFSALFSGDANALSRYFAVTHDANGLILVPRSEMLAKSVNRITVVGTPVPQTVTIEEAGGNRTQLAFTPQGPLPPITAGAPASAGRQ
ncbi:MAG: outer membrane lipoprotein carrier protein LolA [Gammaproteobacteria bacterium]